MNITNPTETDAATADDPILRLENIGQALIAASETMHEYAHQIVANTQQTVATLVPN